MTSCIFITGASSGIGKALAEHYASPGKILILAGRDKKRLSLVEKICKAKGAKVFTKAIDVKDQKAMEDWINEMDGLNPIDLVIANAGVHANKTSPHWQDVEQVLRTNIDGVLNTVLPLIPRMQERRRGHIAVISSLAAYRAFPMKGAYSASKAAVKMFCEAWRIELEPFNIAVTTVCPGFIKTPFTASNNHPMPFILEAEETAMIIAKGLKKKKAIINFPLPVFLFVRLLQCLPVAVSDYLVKWAHKRMT